jgi:hypothetical protein
MKKIPLTDKVCKRNDLEFFYKLNKKTSQNLNIISKSNILNSNYSNHKMRIFLRNFHQKPYWKLRKARIIHWNLFFNKTIRRQRYRVFINKFVKYHKNLSYNYTYFITLFTKFTFSWTRIAKWGSFFKSMVVCRDKFILRLPFFFSYFINWKLLKKKTIY